MKKFFIMLFAIVVLIMSTIAAIPFLFKERISQALLNKANSAVDASINYSSYRLTLLKSFPDFTAVFQNITVIGQGDFEGDTLAFIHQLSARIDVMSVIKKEDLLIRTIGINQGMLQFIVNEKGDANWDIETKQNVGVTQINKAEISQKTNGSTVPSSLKMLMENINITDFDVIYNSIESNYIFAVYGINADLSGEWEGMNTILNVKGLAPSINFNYHGTDYLKNRRIELETKMLANFETWDFVFQAGDTKLNNMPFMVEGGFSMPSDSMFFDLKFDVPNINMKQVLELVPDEYKKSMADIEATGMINFNGVFKGLYYEDIFPLTDISFNINKGKLKYPQLPDELIIHELNAHIFMPEGSFDSLTVGIQNMQLQLANNPFTLHAKFSSLFNDPHLDVNLDGKIDLETLAKIIPLGDIKMKGLMVANASVLGKYSALEKNDFTAFVSKGNVSLTNFYFQNSSVPQGLHLHNASLVLQNQDLKINGMNGNIGRSDFSISGQINHLLTYVFADDILEGKFKLNSKLIDANEFLAKNNNENAAETNIETPSDSSKTAVKSITFPKKVQLNFDAQIAHLLYDKIDITNFNGSIELKNQPLTLKGLRMNMIDGVLNMDGTVLADGRQYPDVVFSLNVEGFDLPAAYRDISMVQKYMPFAAKSQGKFSTKLNVESKLTTNLKMIVSAITAKGNFSTKNVKLMDANYFSNLKSVIQSDKLKNLELDNFTTHFSIENGTLKIDPFKTKLAGQPMKIGGAYNLGGTLDFRVDAQLDKVILSNDIQKMIAYIPGHQNVTKFDVGIDIKGDAKNPEVKVDTDQIKKQVIDQVKNSSQEELKDAAKKLIKDFFK